MAQFPVCLFVPSLGWSPSKLLPRALPCWGPWPGSTSCPSSSHLLRCRKPDHTWHLGCTSCPRQQAPVRWLYRTCFLSGRSQVTQRPMAATPLQGASLDVAGRRCQLLQRWSEGVLAESIHAQEKSQWAQPGGGGNCAIGWHSQGGPCLEKGGPGVCKARPGPARPLHFLTSATGPSTVPRSNCHLRGASAISGGPAADPEYPKCPD